MSGNPANTSRGTIRPDLVGDPNLPTDERTVSRWFNTAAFAAPPSFTFGSAGRNIVEGPGTKLVDINVQKRVPFGSTRRRVPARPLQRLQHTAVRHAEPDVRHAGLRHIIHTGPAREIQLGVRFTF